MTIHELIKEHQEVFSGDPWYGESLLKTLEATPFQLVNYKPQANFHSIAELVKHLLAWKKFFLEKLKNKQEYDIRLNSSLDWEENVLVESHAAWQKLLDELKSSQKEIVTLLADKEDGWLQAQTPGKSYTNQYMMIGLMQHDIYHLGQIRLIRKMAEGLASGKKPLT